MAMQRNPLFRCSRLGDLMTGIIELTENQKVQLENYTDRQNGKGKPLTENQIIEYGKLLEKTKSNDISETAKAFVMDTFLKNEFSYEDVLTSDTLMKGTLLESDAIALVSKFEGTYYRKNKERRSNDYITGELDVKAKTHIKDIKVSKNLATFTQVKNVSKKYYWQAMGYMWLWEIPNYSLTYVLMPDPEEMIERQISRLNYLLVGDDFDVASAQLRHNNDLIAKLPLELRIKYFDFSYNESDVFALKEQIKKARIYYDKLSNEFFGSTYYVDQWNNRELLPSN